MLELSSPDAQGISRISEVERRIPLEVCRQVGCGNVERVRCSSRERQQLNGTRRTG